MKEDYRSWRRRRRNQVEINRLKAELAAKVREAEELQSARKVDKAQIDRLTTANGDQGSLQTLVEIVGPTLLLEALRKENARLRSIIAGHSD